MESIQFNAMQIYEKEAGVFERKIISKNTSELPDGDVLIKVSYSSLNYKDALSSIGNKGVTRQYPHTPGIDAAGIVTESSSSLFKPNDEVIVTGYDLGMNTAGGFGEYIRVPADWVVPCPESLSLKESMIYGTAGFTAALSVYKLIGSGVNPEDGEILVTGATGGVGSIAVSILKKLGYEVIAATGKIHEKKLLQSIGAKDIIDRSELNDTSNRPMLKGRWAGVIDTVGGNTLSTALKMTKYSGSATCCGNVSSHEFTSSIYPFILRGVSLLGIDSVQCPMALRKDIWFNLATTWKIDNINSNVTEVSLEELNGRIDLILAGKHVGRTIINHNL
ncbi:YhdH/YhfP family quinone oxidoreductase [Desulfobacter vibrioformis]|uniref:YhdH/YhfP family quinone oxidoreductase n=1 Tax=Desulfobacter vibrioformis TaxID=34031 RepID=UPI0005561F7C|nr:YhdH/YhfP family quinone oxidoreductase [Desulfobacter vibrioformis]